MTMVEGVVFPSTFAELQGLGSAELRVLVGKLPDGEALHPKIASMGYHMSKAQRLDFIGFHYYGIGTAESAASALTAAEGKYAIHQSKKGNKSGAIKPKTGVATNCSATAGKALAELSQKVPIDTATAAHLDSWAKGITGAADKADISKLLKVVSGASGEEDAVGPALSNLFDLGDVMGDWLNVKEAINPKQQWEAAQSLLANAQKTNGLAPDLTQLAMKEAAEAASDAVVQGSGKVFEALPGLGSSVGKEAVETLQQALALDFDTLPFTTMKGLANQLDDAVDFTAENLGDVADLLAQTPKLADDLQTKLAQYAQTVTPDQAEAIAKAFPGSTVDLLADMTDNAVSAAQEAASAVASEQVANAVAATKEGLLKLSKAELKKLGPATFKVAGVDTPSLAHYLTKDELTEALAKLAHGQKIDELLDVAQAKKVAHKTGAKAAQKADPAPNVADATVLDADQLAAKAKATKKANPVTPAEIEDSIAPEFTPAPETLGVPQAKYPKPPQTQHTWSPKPQQANLGGAHTKYQYVDEDGNVWMWKKAETKGVADGEALAHDIGWDLGFDMADIRYAESWKVPTKGTFPHGTVQKFHDGVKADMTTVKIGDFTAEQITELQEHQVYDWLISQHDTHSENILVMADGHLVPIDKGQAFKFFGADKLEVGYSPRGNFGKPVYYDLWDDYAAGKIDLDLDAIDNMLARIESIPDSEYRSKVEKYVAQRFADGSGIQFLPKKLQSQKALVDAIMERKTNIRAEFTEFYKTQAKRRGIKWDPIWEQRLAGAPAEVIEELGEAAVTAGITTPITKTLAADVERMGTGGKAIKLAGKDVHQGQALAYVEKAEDGSKILRLEMRLEIGADDRLTETLKGITGDLGTGNASSTGGIGYVADTEWSTVEKFAKTVGAHATDGQYNMGTVNEAQNLLSQITGKKINYELAGKQALEAGDIEKWALNQAQIEKLDEYAKHLEAIDTAYKAGVPPPYKASAFDVTKAQKGWVAKAPSAPVQVTEEASEDIFDSLTIGKDRFPQMVRDDDFLGWRRTGAERDLSVNDFGAQKVGKSVGGGVGRQFDGVIDVDGTKVGIHFRSYQQVGATSRKGLIDVEILEWDGSADGIEKAMAAIQRMGVDTKLATAEDEALTYWRILTGTFKNSTEYVQGTGSGPYGKVRSTINAIESKVASSGNLTPQQEIAIYRDAWSETFGADAVARAPERLIPQRNIFGDEMGYGYVHRFDLPEDMSVNFGSGAGGWVHGTSHLTGSDLTSLPGGASTSDLVRHGIYGNVSTTSAASDLYSGGGDGVFTKRGWGGRYTSNNEIILARPASTDLRVGTYNFHSDQFGSMAARDSLYSLDPAQSVSKTLAGGENIARGSLTFGEDMEAVIYRSKAKQTEALSEMKRLGVTEIRGRPVEERILYARSDADAKALITQLTKERKADLYRPYDDVRTAAVPEPKIPTKAKATKTKKTSPTFTSGPEPDVPLASSTPSVADPFVPTPDVPNDPGELANAFTDLKTAIDQDTASLTWLELQGKNHLATAGNLSPDEATAAWDKAISMTKWQTADAFDGNAEEFIHDIAEEGTNYHVLTKVTAGKTKAEALDILTDSEWLHTGAAKQHMAELVGEKGYKELLVTYKQEASAGNAGGDFLAWVKTKAAAGDAPAPKKLTAAAKGGLKVDEDIAPLTTAVPGQKVVSVPTDAVYGYKVPGIGKKVDVQFSNYAGDKYVLAKLPETGDWFLVGKQQGGAPIVKDEVLQMLVDAGYPKAKLA